MKYLLRGLAFLFGVAALLAVVWLGYQTAIDPSPKLVAAFGVASAIVAPIGFVLISYAFKSEDLVAKLSKVPEIEKLIAEAQTHEEKIRLLEKQRQQLAEVVRLEARRQSLLDQKNTLEKNAVRTLEELKATNEELSILDVQIAENAEIAEELDAVRERLSARRRGDAVFTFGKHQFFVSSRILEGVPWGALIYEILKSIARIVWYLQKLLTRRPRQEEQASTTSGDNAKSNTRISAQLLPDAAGSGSKTRDLPASEGTLVAEEEATVEEASEHPEAKLAPHVQRLKPENRRG